MEVTSEFFGSAGVWIHQPRRGYRYGAESLALAAFLDLSGSSRCIELCSGVGVISVLTASRCAHVHITSIEIQEPLHALACRNVAQNGLLGRMQCIHTDYQDFAKTVQGEFDLLFANPPFFSVGEGRVSSSPQRAIARHELQGTIGDLLGAAARLLRSRGRCALVFARHRERELLQKAGAAGFEVQRLDRRTSAYVLVEFWRR